jgi:hypothetical protein
VDEDAQAKKDAKAFAGGCLAGLGTVGLVVTTVALVLVAVVVIIGLLVFLACAGALR